MPRQDIDPLADAQPPRYAYESDDEDETGLASVASTALPDAPSTEITFLPPTQDGTGVGGNLVIASGVVGVAWARGAKLGEQIGQVNVNRRAIGLVFRPTWAGPNNTVVVSETFTRLPVWTMSPYAAAVLERWRPARVILLDAYSTATYISPTPIPHHEAPLRYLSTEPKPPPSNVSLTLFAPPNLLQSTTAAFLNLLALPESNSNQQQKPASTGLAILVPSSHAPLPTPRTLNRDEEEGDSETQPSIPLSALFGLADSENWDPVLLREAHRAVLEATGGTIAAEEWDDSRAFRDRRTSERSAGRRKLTEAEERMYI